ncbi:hypothetical protein NEMIN01_1911 [Nematocida minor]|uniref:uncharacterized protein n=1 Tax=Nematocida minor TaxID=1912983 RepID=UPI00221E8197|nr:uncharacterized protein NEMIN01_1911 [Nematocida minor]KAI5192259.1 hypothetical protein NEMIN01_1911 [Nematocida minor]
MKRAESVAETLKKGQLLQKEKETENNWNKIDEILERVSEINKKEEAQEIVQLVPLMCMGVQSNRSKLSGSGCKALSKLFENLGDELKEHLPQIFTSLMSALGKTNKVIFMRAMGTASTIASTCSLRAIAKQIRLNVASQSKTVRQGLLEMAVRGIEKERIKELVEVLETLVDDVNPEIRAKAREGMAKLSELDRKAFIGLSNSQPEKTKELPEKEEKVSVAANDINIQPSVISSVRLSPNTSAIKIKDSGANVIIRGPLRSIVSNMPCESVIRPSLKPGYSLERIGHRLEMHKKEIEEGMKKEWTPRKTPVIKKRQRESTNTPLSASKNIKYSEAEKKDELTENDSLNLSEEIGNLSITRTEDETEHIVENKDMYDSIFSSKEAKGTKEFIESCEAFAEDPLSEAEYSILAPDVFIRRSTTKKI